MSRITTRVQRSWNLRGLFSARRKPAPDRRLVCERLESRNLLAMSFSGYVYVQGVKPYPDPAVALTPNGFPNGHEMVAVPNAVVKITVPVAGGTDLLVGVTNSNGFYSVTDTNNAQAGGTVAASVFSGDPDKTPYYVADPLTSKPYSCPLQR